MNTFNFLFHFFLIFPLIHASQHDCKYSWCNNILIRFPFQLQGNDQHQHQHRYCGYPGFKLTCTIDNKTVLSLPHSGDFYVRKINYLRQKIEIYDPNHCLPNRLLSLNLSDSPFFVKFHRNYTFLRCSTRNIGSQFIPIHCLSNSTHSVLAIPSMNLTKSLPESCYVLRNVSLPVKTYENLFGDGLSDDIQLTWYSPDCEYCKSRDGMCGFESIDSYQIRCFLDHQTGRLHHGLGVSRIILLSIAGAAMMCAIGIAFFTCFKSRRATTISPQPTTITIGMMEMSMRIGLDESTIESFEKVVLGESLRLPGVAPSDGSCSICLSEYNNKDVIRCIPECTHCFHAHCIDEWLRLNATCPLCRNSPSPPHSLH